MFGIVGRLLVFVATRWQKGFTFVYYKILQKTNFVRPAVDQENSVSEGRHSKVHYGNLEQNKILKDMIAITELGIETRF